MSEEKGHIACKLDPGYSGVAEYVNLTGASLLDKYGQPDPFRSRSVHQLHINKEKTNYNDRRLSFALCVDKGTFDRLRLISMRTGESVRNLVYDAIRLYSLTFLSYSRMSIKDGLRPDAADPQPGVFSVTNPFGLGAIIPPAPAGDPEKTGMAADYAYRREIARDEKRPRGSNYNRGREVIKDSKVLHTDVKAGGCNRPEALKDLF